MPYLRPGFIVVIVGAVLTSVSTIIVALRYYCRHFLTGTVTISDHLMLTALVVTWGNFVINYYQDESSSMYRPRQLKNPAKRPKAENALHGVLVTWYLYRATYVIGLCFAKLSILFFYRHIATQITFRRLVTATIVFVSAYSFASAVASIVQCKNPADAWSTVNYIAQFDKTIQPIYPKCFDPTKLWIFCAIANLITDIVILLLPIPALLSLKVPMSKRLGLIAIFSIGFVVVIAASVRMYFITLWAQSPENSAKFGTDLLLWGQVETNAGIISASVPFLRVLFQGKQEIKEKRVTRRVMEISPPQASKGSHDQSKTAVSTSDAKANASKSPGWGQFITIPVSLNSGGSSMRVEPASQHTMV